VLFSPPQRVIAEAEKELGLPRYGHVERWNSSKKEAGLALLSHAHANCPVRPLICITSTVVYWPLRSSLGNQTMHSAGWREES